MPESQVTTREVDAASLRLAYCEMGTGPAVLLLHGWPTSSFLWRNVMPPIARSHRVLAPGASEHPRLPRFLAGGDAVRHRLSGARGTGAADEQGRTSSHARAGVGLEPDVFAELAERLGELLTAFFAGEPEA